MKYLGIDYGTKRIGIAISDESGGFAFPKTILNSGVQALTDLINLIEQEKITSVVIGNSLDQIGERNAIMEDVDVFAEELRRLTGVNILYSDERFSSTAARAATWLKPVATPRRSGGKEVRIDDQAAAIMLQRYLDKL